MDLVKILNTGDHFTAWWEGGEGEEGAAETHTHKYTKEDKHNQEAVWKRNNFEFTDQKLLQLPKLGRVTPLTTDPRPAYFTIELMPIHIQ